MRCFAIFAAMLCYAGVLPTGEWGGTAAARTSGRRSAPPVGTGLRPGSLTRTVAIGSGRMWVPLDLSGGKPGALYSLTLAARDPDTLRRQALLDVRLRIGSSIVAAKRLHNGDPELYLVFRANDPRALTLLEFQGQINGPTAAFHLTLRRLASEQQALVVEAEPNDTWQQAQPVPLGATVIGTADDRAYLPAPGSHSPEEEQAGTDWFRFEQTDPRPKLVALTLEIPDGDLPASLACYVLQANRLVPCDPTVPSVSGAKQAKDIGTIAAPSYFCGVLRKGVYYVRVMANHPLYRLRTQVFDAPPYSSDPRKAILPALNYLSAAGCDWLSHASDSGALLRRDTQPHTETMLRAAGPAALYSAQAIMTAYRSGYSPSARESLRFLMERLYNCPRAFAPLSGSSWMRDASAPATDSARAANALADYETLTGERRSAYYGPVAAYLRAFYNRSALPPGETSDAALPNTPNTGSISRFETGWLAWTLLNRLAQLPNAPANLRRDRDRLALLLSGEDTRTLDDVCFQTILVAESAPSGQSNIQRLKENVQKIFALQRPDGFWPRERENIAGSSEAQTGKALFALAKAGVSRDELRVRRAMGALLARQKPFGGWSAAGRRDDVGARCTATAWVVMGLTALFPGPRATGWTNGQQPTTIRMERADQALADLIAVWDAPTPELLARARRLLKSPEALVRAEALNTLGRVADNGAIPLLLDALGDDAEMVGHAAACALREIITRGANTGSNGAAIAALVGALHSPRANVRRAALLAFAQHDRWLTRDASLRDAVLLIAAKDEDAITQIRAARALSLWWFWTGDLDTRERILNTIFAALGEENLPANVLDAFQQTLYNICDENIHHLYDIWAAELPRETDPKTALARQEFGASLLADRIASVLRKASPFQTRQIVLALTAYPGARVWNPADQIARSFACIGTDCDAPDFRGGGALALRPVLLTLLGNIDPMVRQRALVLTSALRSTGGQPFLANAIVARLDDPDPDVRLLARQAHLVFPFQSSSLRFGSDPRRFPAAGDANRNADTLPLLMRLRNSPRTETQADARKILAEFDSLPANSDANDKK